MPDLKTKPSTLIITGMHRSGTSLIASFLEKVGIDLGNNLLPGNYGNPRGYFEDRDFVEFQRSLLKSCCDRKTAGFPDWGWTESESLDKEKLQTQADTARKLLASRQNNSGIWGWKDPRTSLILEFWHQLIPNPRYLLVYRFPWDVADSILRLNLPGFQEKPDYALKIWSYYNRHLLEFYRQHSDSCLLVSMNRLLENPEKLTSLIEAKLEINLDLSGLLYRDITHVFNGVYEPSKFSSLHHLHPLIKALYFSSREYFENLLELDRLADLPSQFSLEDITQKTQKDLPGSRLPLMLHHEAIKANLSPDSPQFLSWLVGCVAQYQNSAFPEMALAELRQARQKMADFWIETKDGELKNAYLNGIAGKAHQLLLSSGIREETATDAERDFGDSLAAHVRIGFEAPQAIGYLLAAMLYRRADQLPVRYRDAVVPQWFLQDMLKFLLYFPRYFEEEGEVENYCRYMESLTDFVERSLRENPNSNIWRQVALFFADRVNFVPLYFSDRNLKNFYTKRAEVMEFFLKSSGHELDWRPPERPANRAKIRLGVLKGSFSPNLSETFTTIPAFEYLDREKFEIILYVQNRQGNPLEQYCASRADKLVELPQDSREQAKTIRADDLDILFVGSIVSNAAHSLLVLAMHRLARITTTYFASPVTTGIRNLDYYISGTLAEQAKGTQKHYSEQLVLLEGTGFCFDYSIHPVKATIKADRDHLGIPEDAVVFVSGANMLKIIPEVREDWAKIIASVPKAYLILYPFGATWSDSYPQRAFINKIQAILARNGVDKSRLLILPKPLASREDVKELLKVADVYLDSYPYAGANSTVDPLEVGLPAVMMEGNSLRSRQGAALLRDLEIPELITQNQQEYIDKAIALGTNPELRQEISDRIQQKMAQTPKFLNPRAYSAQLGSLFEDLLAQHLHPAQKSDLKGN
jgi:predicted O-linked N-acetylglucosamine transferase (SPINDLY family)